MNAGFDALRQLYPWSEERPCANVANVPLGWLEECNRDLFREMLGDETRCVVELGTWTGLSARYMLDCAPHACCICIDHFRGSEAHRRDPYYRRFCARLYAAFCMRCWEYRERLCALRTSTDLGLRLVRDFGLTPDLIYVDADHRYPYVRSDIEAALAWFPGAILVGDDYCQEENRDFAVRRAVDDVVEARHIETFGTRGGAWYILPAPRETVKQEALHAAA